MSRGRPRHQASRRRTYSARQRELRDRRTRVAGQELETPRQEEPVWLTEPVAFEIEDGLDFEAPTTWGTRLRGRSSAA
jgi:hypothetical protein